MQSSSGRAIIPLRTRPLTLGEILFREENEESAQPPPRSMSRITSPSRRLGSLANGRPRRPRARTLARPTTSASSSAANSDNDSQPRRHRATSAPQPIPSLLRWRSAATEAHARQMRGLNEPDPPLRRGNSGVIRTRHNNVAGRPEPAGLFGNSNGRQRNNQQGRSRSRANSSLRSVPFLGGPPQRTAPRSMVPRRTQSTSTNARMIDVYDSRGIQEPTYSSYSRSPGRASTSFLGSLMPDSNSTNGTARAGSISPVTRFINFAAEFMPVTPHPPDAEPPEWSFDITAADFGPFAIGRSEVSRAHSLAMIAALSQVDEAELNNEFNSN